MSNSERTPEAERGEEVTPRYIEQGAVPLVAVEGGARDCGREYAELVLSKYPGYRRYLDPACRWHDELSAAARRLFERTAPHIPEVYEGMREAAGPAAQVRGAGEPAGCTSFGVSGALTLDGHPISGQTKDTVIASARQYIVLRMRITGAPTVLVLAYPGEVLGYGLWSTGMSIFRNTLYSSGDATSGLAMEQWGTLALAGTSVHAAAELAEKHGIAGCGNCLISDPGGESLSVEYNVGGVGIVAAEDGIATHANHPEGEATAPSERYLDEAEKENSRRRMRELRRLLAAERGRLTAQKAMMSLAEHSRYPYGGICRHSVGGNRGYSTTAGVVAEPTLGKLHVTRGNPCCNWPATYTI